MNRGELRELADSLNSDSELIELLLLLSNGDVGEWENPAPGTLMQIWQDGCSKCADGTLDMSSDEIERWILDNYAYHFSSYDLNNPKQKTLYWGEGKIVVPRS